MKKLFKIIFAAPLLSMFFLSGCRDDGKTRIGIIQIVEHESLDNLRKEFISELEKMGYEEGKNAEFDIQIAGGDLANCSSIAQKFADERKNLILAISTPCAQAAANASKDIPILATAITDFEGAGLVCSKERPGMNVTGVSDLAPIDKIIGLISKLKPGARKIGILYSCTDLSPQYQAKVAEEVIKGMGLEAKSYSISQNYEISQVAEKLADEVDALYVPIDKITFSAMPQISQIFLSRGKFVVSAEDSMISQGAAATYGINYGEIGKIAAAQAGKILSGVEKVEDMPVQYIKDAKLNLNYEILKSLNIRVPDELKGES